MYFNAYITAILKKRNHKFERKFRGHGEFKGVWRGRNNINAVLIFEILKINK